MFYLTTHSAHFIDGYIASNRIKKHAYSEREKPATATSQTTLFD